MNSAKKKRSQIELMHEILKALYQSNELSIRGISSKVNSAYRSVLPALDFLKFCKIIKERKEVIRNTEYRLFSFIRK